MPRGGKSEILSEVLQRSERFLQRFCPLRVGLLFLPLTKTWIADPQISLQRDVGELWESHLLHSRFIQSRAGGRFNWSSFKNTMPLRPRSLSTRKRLLSKAPDWICWNALIPIFQDFCPWEVLGNTPSCAEEDLRLEAQGFLNDFWYREVQETHSKQCSECDHLLWWMEAAKALCFLSLIQMPS